MSVLQVSSVSLILFVVYQSGTFKKEKENVKGYIATWFADN